MTQKKGFVDAPAPITSRNNSSSATQSPSDDADYEKAIQASVRETSRGNKEEDVVIEAAIRRSVRAMRARNVTLDSLPGASKLPEKDPSIFHDEEYRITDEEYQELIEKAIQQSMTNHGGDFHPRQGSGAIAAGPAPGSTTPGSRHNVDFEKVIEESRNPTSVPHADDEVFLQQAIEASKKEMHRQQSQRNEEDIVLEYVKKQSLAEEEYRRALNKGNDGEEDNDEELKRALEESLQLHKGYRAGPSVTG